MNLKTGIIIGILVIAVVLLVGCLKLETTTECGNNICESGEDGLNCAVDCCVSGDGKCPVGCAPADDGDCEPVVVNKSKLLRWTESKRKADGGYHDGHFSDEFSTLFGAFIYFEFGDLPPNPEKVISFYDSKQADDGSWGAGEYHWGPITGQTLMIYRALNATPAKPLDGFFEKIDTWPEVVNFTRTYSKGNFWGGIWGPIAAWYSYYGEDPPWWDDYDKAVREYRHTWESDTHQSSHVLFAYYQLGKPLPDFSVDPILESQKQDGSWAPDIGETGFALSILLLYYNNVEPRDSIIEAMRKAKPYVLGCYRETEDYAWFTPTPYSEERMLIRTWNGLLALNIINSFYNCGDNICDSGEDGYNCPGDCCVSGDGKCPVGCTSAKDDDCKTGNLSEVKVAVLYEYVTDGAFIGRGMDDVVNLLKETKTDLIFRGFWRWSPCPESPDKIPPDHPDWYPDYAKKRAKEGYTYQQLKEAIKEIKKDNPDVIFCGAIPAQRITMFAWNPMTEEYFGPEETWEMAVDPEKWGISESKEDFQKRFAIWHGWLEEEEEYDPKQVSSYYPDITNEKFQELFLGWAEKQIDCGADAIWIDMLFEQAKMLAKITRDLNHSAVKESFEAASKMVDEIHRYGESKGKHIYVGSWGSSIIYPYPQPDLDFITASPSSKEVYLMELNETYWDIVTTAVKEKLGDIPFFVFIDWAVSTRDPLGVFSHYLTPEEQREFLGTADEFFQEKGINFIYPVHGGWMGHDTKIFSFGKSSFYDSIAPEFETYETIKELAQNKSKRE